MLLSVAGYDDGVTAIACGLVSKDARSIQLLHSMSTTNLLMCILLILVEMTSSGAQMKFASLSYIIIAHISYSIPHSIRALVDSKANTKTGFRTDSRTRGSTTIKWQLPLCVTLFRWLWLSRTTLWVAAAVLCCVRHYKQANIQSMQISTSTLKHIRCWIVAVGLRDYYQITPRREQ